MDALPPCHKTRDHIRILGMNVDYAVKGKELIPYQTSCLEGIRENSTNGLQSCQGTTRTHDQLVGIGVVHVGNVRLGPPTVNDGPALIPAVLWLSISAAKTFWPPYDPRNELTGT